MSPVDVAPEISRVLNLAGTLENLGGDPELYRELFEFFMDLVPQQLDDLEAVVAAGDVPAVDLQAHSMKGGAANVGAVRVAEASRELEMLAKSGSLDGAQAIFARIREEFAALQAAAAGLDWSQIS
ncbi:MAG: Hpt domain-containing protein [Candidatus Krumholzibacteriia bacterium]